MAKAPERVEKKQPEYGSDVIVDLMKAFDIEYTAFNPGATFRGIHDSIVNYGGNYRPEVIFCFHEEISVALAHGYAKARGKPMIAITHNIVGLQHASMAIFNAWIDRVPVIVLGATGPMNTTRRRPRIDWIHTALVQGTQVRDYVKWDDQPFSLDSVPESFIRGYRIATTEPMAPIYINYDADLQEDALKEAIEIPDVTRFSPPAPMQANPEALRRAAQLLVEAKAPLIIADRLGRNPKTVASLVELAELLAIPVMDKGGRFNFPNTHPLDITGGVRELLQKADVVLALDVMDLYGALTEVNRMTRVSEYITSPSVKIVHISMNDMLVRSWAADYQVLQAVDVPISADTSVAVPELTQLCRQMMSGDWKRKGTIETRFNAIKERHDGLRAKWLLEARARAGRKEISTAFLAYELGEVIKKEDWVLVNGNSNGWERKLWDWTEPNQYLGGSGGAGVGYGMSAAIGAALAHLGSGKLCVDIQADGDLLMTASSLWTAAHHKIPLLIVMHNNQSFYNSEEHGIQIAKFRRRPVENAGIGTHVDDPSVNFAKMAESFGVHAEGPIEGPADLRPALRRALKVVKEKKLPALVDVVAEPR
ncbi:MAG: thiamine pyrophosphate-binding protein [Deltaproteobacteria bacterium]|nr:thiamine pyrophosphate-binding protein [Deltaproteobacteria bacterium]